MTDVSDMDLARKYAAGNSEPAFAELVCRHVNLVYSVALRFVGNAGDAQDVAQAVFIILAQKAGDLPERTVLTGWLYETTRFTALRFLRTKTRRQSREQEAYMQSSLNEPHSDGVWQRLAPLLEDAMARLNEKERALLALRFFENKNGAEAAVALGMNEWAARKRVERALEKLRTFFGKRGAVFTATAIAGAISAHSVQAAPIGLAGTISGLAITKGATAGSSTLALVKGTLKLMAWSKMHTVVIAGAIVLLAAGTTQIIRHHRQLSSSPPPGAVAVSADEEKAMAISRMNAAKQIVIGMLEYAGDHQNRLPTSLDQIATYIKTDPDTQSRLEQFDIVFQGSLADVGNPQATVLIREKQPVPTRFGTWSTAYGLADGHSEIRVARGKSN